MSIDPIHEADLKHGSDQSAYFRPQDRVLYTIIAGYILLLILIMTLSHGSFAFIDVGKAFGIFIPVLLVVLLILIQIARRPRFSPVAFILAILAILSSGYIALMLAGAASAAV